MLPPAHQSGKALAREPRSENPLLEFVEEVDDLPLPRKAVRPERADAPQERTPFLPERKRVAPEQHPPKVEGRSRSGAAIVLAIGLPLTLAGAAWSAWSVSLTDDAIIESRMASLSVTSKPEGAQVIVDDQPRGVTPLAIQIAPGSHTLTIRAGAAERVMTFTASPGADIQRDLEIAPPPVPAPAPRTAAAMTAAVPTAPATAAAGWLTISAPFEVQLVERGDVVGTSAARRVMLPSGRHELLVVNRLYEFEQPRTVEIRPGETTTLRVQVPPVSVHVSAWPWAEVIVDGESLGQTPLANVSMSVGPHKIVFRHPELGERQQDVVITSRQQQRVFADLTR